MVGRQWRIMGLTTLFIDIPQTELLPSGREIELAIYFNTAEFGGT